LTTNYRSDHRLLEKFDEIFSKMGRNGYLKFTAGIDSIESTILTSAQESDLIKKIEYSGNNNDEQMDGLFKEIQNQKTLIQSYEENGHLSDQERMIAVLVRENWQIENILQESRKRGMYIETDIGGNLYQLSPALDLYKLVLALISPKDPVVLYNLILSNYINIDLDIQGLHGLKKEEKSRRLIEAINVFLTENSDLTWESIIKI
jgi:ATP-dependent exoDNAse (exonuclease V) beta subunit